MLAQRASLFFKLSQRLSWTLLKEKACLRTQYSFVFAYTSGFDWSGCERVMPSLSPSEKRSWVAHWVSDQEVTGLNLE
jgi:hypothetical protein